jgi:hypothetical protein
MPPTDIQAQQKRSVNLRICWLEQLEFFFRLLAKDCDMGLSQDASLFLA